MTQAKFNHPIVVSPADIDGNGHINNVTYLRWVQDAATAHWFAVVSEEIATSITWVVVRHEIDYKRPGFQGDRLIARTWIGKAGSVVSERLTEIFRPQDNQLLAKARTLWCIFDPTTGRPKRIDPSIHRYFES